MATVPIVAEKKIIVFYLPLSWMCCFLQTLKALISQMQRDQPVQENRLIEFFTTGMLQGRLSETHKQNIFFSLNWHK